MPVIDVHTHVTPERYKEAIRTQGSWHGLGPKAGQLDWPGFVTPLPERLAEMDEIGVDMQLVTPTVGFYQYDNDLETTKTIARDCNDEVGEMVEQYPTRFAGIATLPMQDISAAVAELERVMLELKLKGVIVSDHVNGRTYDEPEFLPFFEAAEELTRPPSTYLDQFYYDCCTFSGPALRFLIDTVGIDRVMLGTDYPAPMVLIDAVDWVNGLDCLTAEEKDAILTKNPAAFLGLSPAEGEQ